VKHRPRGISQPYIEAEGIRLTVILGSFRLRKLSRKKYTYTYTVKQFAPVGRGHPSFLFFPKEKVKIEASNLKCFPRHKPFHILFMNANIQYTVCTVCSRESTLLLALSPREISHLCIVIYSAFGTLFLIKVYTVSKELLHHSSLTNCITSSLLFGLGNVSTCVNTFQVAFRYISVFVVLKRTTFFAIDL
jgi:hypothetical protein